MRVLSKNTQTGHQGDYILHKQIPLIYMKNGSKNPFDSFVMVRILIIEVKVHLYNNFCSGSHLFLRHSMD